MWTWTLAEQLAQDIGYALRVMARNPLFTAMATLSLALGIGANTAIYSFMDAVLLRALPVKHPEELVVLKWRAKAQPPVMHGGFGSIFPEGKTGRMSPNYPFAAFETLRTNQTVLTTLFGYGVAPQLNLVSGGQAEAADGLLVSGGFYSALGVSPAAGRLIAEDDDRPGSLPVAVISYNYWQGHFASNLAAMGTSLLVNNIPVTIVGVSAREFFGVNPALEPKVFLPLHSWPLYSQQPGDDEKDRFFDSHFYWVEMMGRLRPGVSIQQAEAVLGAQFHAFVESTASTDMERAALPALHLEEGSSGIDSLRRQYSQPLYILMTMVGLILIIACANIANLLLARAAARRREIAVRLSLGASRLRIVRQLLTESVLLALMGGVLGLLVATWGIQSITWLLANGRQNFTLHAGLSWGVLAFTLGLSLMTGVVFGLAPAIQATRVDLTPTLKEARAGSRGHHGFFGRYLGANRILVVAQIAISLLLVIGASLFVRTFANLTSVDLGFNRENVLTFMLNARQGGYQDAGLDRFYAELRDRLRTLPGVRSASISNFPLAAQYYSSNRIFIPGAPVVDGKQPEVAMVEIDPFFLGTMEIPMLLGRGIEQRDMSSPKVAVITERFAAKFFGSENPIGRTIGFGDPKKSTADIEIIGIAKTTHYSSIKEEDIPPVAYVPYTQNVHFGRVTFELRTSGDPLALVNAVRQVVRQSSPNLPLTKVTTQALQIDQTISQERTFADLGSGMAILALLIACLGLYGTMAYSVARRTSEIGIRMALGAARRNVIWMVLREVLLQATAGLAIGMLAAWQSAPWIKSFLFGTKPTDPLAISFSVAILLIAVLSAGYAPAWRASRIDPLTALRHE